MTVSPTRTPVGAYRHHGGRHRQHRGLLLLRTHLGLCSLHVRQSGRYVLVPDHQDGGESHFLQPCLQLRRFMCHRRSILPDTLPVEVLYERWRIVFAFIDLIVIFAVPLGKGELAEWLMAAVLKTVDLNGFGGSNPSLSARKAVLRHRLYSFHSEV